MNCEATKMKLKNRMPALTSLLPLVFGKAAYAAAHGRTLRI